MPRTEIEKAIYKMIQVELDAMNYYCQATEAMRDEGAVFHFTLLADEELAHALSFYEVYPGSDLPPFEALVEESAKGDRTIGAIDTELMARLDERQALQLALRLEKEIEGNLRRMAAEIENKDARDVVNQNADSTLGHYEMIRDDYTRLYGPL